MSFHQTHRSDLDKQISQLIEKEEILSEQEVKTLCEKVNYKK
jgi:hypothetical protein